MAKNLKIEYKDVIELTPYENNSRTHSEDQVAKIAKSIQEFGFNNPILIDEKGVIVAGHGRLLAAKKLGVFSVPTITLTGLTDDQRKAYLITDNRLAELGDWDHNLLLDEVNSLMDLDFNLDDIGLDDSFIGSLNSYEQYMPVLDPSKNQVDITENQVEKQEKKMGTAYQEKSEQNLIEIICPHCAEEFNIDPEALRRNA